MPLIYAEKLFPQTSHHQPSQDCKSGWPLAAPCTLVERFNMLYADSVSELFAVLERWPPEQAQVFLDSITDLAQALED